MCDEKQKFIEDAWQAEWERIEAAGREALKLLSRGFEVFGSHYDGDKTDWIAGTPDRNHLWTLQVKSTNRGGSHGLPTVPLRYGHSRTVNPYRRYKKGDFDFIVGYDLFTNTAYVWSWKEVEHLKATVTICPEAAERWDKLL
jgi:hypothetical protein